VILIGMASRNRIISDSFTRKKDESCMRNIEYLSPTSLKIWKTDKEAFYLQYLSDNRPPRLPQNQPMSIGSAFDAYAKSYLYTQLFGAGHNPKYDFEALFEAQVEPQNRDWARQHGAYAFDQYKSCGALADLMLDLKKANGEPRFEFEVRGAVHGYREAEQKQLSQVTLLGKPDVYFINEQGAEVILDFKVNGYCSRYAHSPLAGYVRMRSAGKTFHGTHKACQPMMVHGVTVNVATFLENIQPDWAAQLAIYAWLCGSPIGSKFITAIDQVVCDATKGHLPALRFAEHRLMISAAFQEQVFRDAIDCWETVQSGWIFRDMSLEDSKARCELLDMQKEALLGEGTSKDQWFAASTRG
jgi:hypothetical protein